MKIAGVIPTHNYTDELRTFDQIKSLSDVTVVLDDNSRIKFPYEPTIYLSKKGGTWNGTSNDTMLFHQAWLLGADWILRLDDDMRIGQWKTVEDVREVIRQHEQNYDSIKLRLFEFWGDKKHIRVDGIWGEKTWATLVRNPFTSRVVHLNDLPHHQKSIDARPVRDKLIDGPVVYHSGCMTKDRRKNRVKKHEALDPWHKYQDRGYKYMLDDQYTELRDVPENA